MNVYEEWEAKDAMPALRGDGPETGMAELIVDADVHRHAISSSGPA